MEEVVRPMMYSFITNFQTDFRIIYFKLFLYFYTQKQLKWYRNVKLRELNHLIMTANSQTSSFRISDIAFDTEIPNYQAQKKTHQRQEYVRKVIQVRSD